MSNFGVKGMRYDFPKPSNIGVSGNPLRSIPETNIKLAKVLLVQRIRNIQNEISLMNQVTTRHSSHLSLVNLAKATSQTSRSELELKGSIQVFRLTNVCTASG